MSAPWRSESRSSRDRAARKMATGQARRLLPLPLREGVGGGGCGSAPPPPPNPLPQGEGEYRAAPIPLRHRSAAADGWRQSPCRRCARCASSMAPNRSHRYCVQPERRFVQQPERGPRQRQPSQRQPAPLSRRQHPRRQVSQFLQPHCRQRRTYRAAGQSRREPQILSGSQRRLHRILVPDIRHQPRVRRQIGQRIPAIPGQCPGRRRQQPRQQPQQRRFPRPVRPGQQQRPARSPRAKSRSRNTSRSPRNAANPAACNKSAPPPCGRSRAGVI